MNIIKSSFQQLISHHKCVTPIEYILEILPKCHSNGPWVAGGSLLRTLTGESFLDGDIDVFFQNKQQFENYVYELVSNSSSDEPHNDHNDRTNKHYIVKHRTPTEWHTTIVLEYLGREWKIQCVKFIYFNCIESLFNSFDFDICMLAYDGESLFSDNQTLDAIKNKKIALRNIKYPAVTLYRLVKYMRRGYDISDSDVQLIVKSLNKKGLKGLNGLIESTNNQIDKNYSALTKCD